MKAARKHSLHTFPRECRIIACGWHWRLNMWQHCEMHHSFFDVNEERVAARGWWPGELVAFEKGEAAFRGFKRKSQCTNKGGPAKRKKVR